MRYPGLQEHNSGYKGCIFSLFSRLPGGIISTASKHRISMIFSPACPPAILLTKLVSPVMLMAVFVVALTAPVSGTELLKSFLSAYDVIPTDSADVLSHFLVQAQIVFNADSLFGITVSLLKTLRPRLATCVVRLVTTTSRTPGHMPRLGLLVPKSGTFQITIEPA